jgi:hypothetical protein
VLPVFDSWIGGQRCMDSQMNMFRPVLGSLKKVAKEAVPCLINGILEMDILLLVDHLYKKTSLAAPEKSQIIIRGVS